MKISDNDNASYEYSKKLDSKLRNQNASKEAEIEKLKEVYDKRVDAVKVEGKERYLDSLRNNDEQLVNSAKEFEEKINNYKEHLERTQKNISQEELALKMDHDHKMHDSKEQHEINIHDQYKNALETQIDLHEQLKNDVRSLSDKTKVEKNHLEKNARVEVLAVANDYNQKGITGEREFRTKLEADVHAHEDQIRFQKNELKSVMDRNTEQSKRLVEAKTEVQAGQLKYLDDHQRDMLAQKQADFKVRYENMIKEHDTALAQIKSQLDSDMHRIVQESSTQKRMIANKGDDAFYRLESLNPSVADEPNNYIVSLKVPDHEKDNVHLSVHGRDLRMTMVRKYNEKLDEPDGTSNKTIKNELFSKEFNSKDILDHKNITQKYEDGILSFKIKKL